ncbi:MAG: PAS domain-containing protein [Candidatus Loosdrechtia sp.]|uniref:PAS domain-containing protein n=1 Tax=Candidatus Loosdrechtia sp. TaxID=3101272 RepID=UPI003A6772B3|nr:MAG: PAS domain-containing protein [Candidatus Jettenia sp. AMX2]
MLPYLEGSVILYFKHISDYAYSFRIESCSKLVCECVTEGFTAVTGYTIDDVNIQGWQRLIYPGDISVFLKHLHRLYTGKSNTSEFRIVTKNGKIHWLCDYALPVWSKSEGRIIRIYGASAILHQHVPGKKMI